MTSFYIRPRFQKKVAITVEELKSEIRKELEKTTDCIGSFSANMAIIKLPFAEQHYWSPQLSLTLDQHEGYTEIRGLYGPNPSIWVMFAFGYGALSVVGLFHLIIGFSLWQMGKGFSVLSLLAVEISLVLVLYVAAQMGQKKGASQLYRLHFFFENVIHEKIEIE